MAKNVWTDLHTQRLIELHKSQKHSTLEMAVELSVSQKTIYNRLEELYLSPQTLPRRHRAPVKFEFSQKEKEEIVRLHSMGKYVTEIAESLGKTLGPVRRICAELGLEASNFRRVLLGERFGRLVVIGHAPPRLNPNGSYGSCCVVQCHCGVEKVVSSFNLRSGNTQTCGCKFHLRNPDSPYIRIRGAYSSGAISRGFKWEITDRQLRYLVQLKCSYCEAEESNKLIGRSSGRSNGEERFKYMGIDRVDPTDDYRPGNVLPACWMCNRAKREAPLSDFVAWLRRLGSDKRESDLLREAIRIGLELEKLT